MVKIYTKAEDSVTRPIDIARLYANLGVKVFPCRAREEQGVDSDTGDWKTWLEKSPYTSNGLNGATRSDRILDIWFNGKHPNALVGAPTGENLGAWVLDIDVPGGRHIHDGRKWLADMEAMHEPLPDTAKAQTASGGIHYMFKHVPGVRNKAAIAEGVDTRGDGGFIIMPGSVMADGREYKWLNHEDDGLPEFLDAPQWLLDLVLPKYEAPIVPTDYVYSPGNNDAYIEKAIRDELELLARTGQGKRGEQVNKSAFSIGTFVGAGVLSRSVAEAELFAAAVANGVVAKDGEREIRAKIRRGLDAGIRNPRIIPESNYRRDNDNTPAVAEDAIKGLQKKQEAKKKAKADAREEGLSVDDDGVISEPKPGSPLTAEPKKRERFDITWFADIKEGEPKEMFIKSVLGVREFTTISGLPGTGKSVITTDMACHVAANMDWHGRKVKHGLVIYVAAERKKLTERRMMAFRKKHGVSNIPLLVIGGRLDFTKDLKDAKELIAAIKQAEVIANMPCVWVIIDTLTRVFGGGDQNASKDMSRFVQSCDEILTETTAHVTAIHHSAWSGERGKGAIDLDGAVDASFMVKKNHGKYKLICDGTNDGEEGTILTFDMESIEIGHDEDGEPTTSPVVVASEEPKPPTSGTLKGYKGDVLKALRTAIDKNGIEPREPHFPEDIAVVDEKTWRDEFYSTRDMASVSQAETAKKQFQRAPEALIKDGHVVRQGVWYWAA